jgi:hypothetical protein
MTPFWHAAQAAAPACRQRRGNSKPAPVHSAQRTRRIQKNVMMLCRQGRYRRALRLLDRNPLLYLRAPENLQRVRDLHPLATAPVVAPDLAGLPDAPMLSADAVVAKLQAMDSFSAAGPDLLSARMLKLVLDDAPGSFPGSTGGEILCAVAQMFANGEMPADIMPLFSSTVLATPKPTGGVRPLAIGMTLRRLISSVVLQRVTSTAREYLAPHQVAVGVKSGCDLVVHEVRSAIDEHGADDAYVLVRVDARNAFNKQSARIC